MKQHPLSVIESGARVAEDVVIGPFCSIGNDVEIGAGCVLGPHVTLLPYTSLGRTCSVHAGAVLGDTPQDLAFKEAPSYVRIGDGCVLREGVTVHRGTKPETSTEVGAGCLLMANSHLAHNVKLGDGVILANGALLGGYVEVGARAFISGNVIIHQFTRIGRLAMLAGASGIGQDVPPFCMTAGVERNRIAGLNSVGLKRAGFTVEERLAIKRAFAILYREGLNTRQALERLRATFTDGPAAEFATFIEASTRGICPCRGAADATDG